MQKAADAADISVLFFQLVLIFGQFWVIFGPFWQFWVIFGPFGVIFGLFWVILGNFSAIFGANFFGQKFISAIFWTFCISGPGGSAKASRPDHQMYDHYHADVETLFKQSITLMIR